LASALKNIAQKKYTGRGNVLSIFLTTRFYLCIAICIVLFVTAFFVPVLFFIPKTCFYIFLAFVGIDYLFLFILNKAPIAKRITTERYSNGDNNKVTLQITNTMNFDIDMVIIEELPFQFQNRNWQMKVNFKKNAEKKISYHLRPITRGAYHFGNIIMYVQSKLGLLVRRCDAEAGQTVQVYPSFIQMRKYELISQTTIQSETGNKRLRKMGHSMEFEQIKEYVRGDDTKTINWKATARKSSLMVNNFTDEKSQQVYCIIDKGRLMKMPFNELSLLDYAINSTLVLSNVCLQKQDKIGLISFSNKIGTILPAEKKPTQKTLISQVLCNETTDYLESDFELLYMQIRSRIKQRSLLVLYTNFESMQGLNRQLPYLKAIAKHHLLLVIFFENTELTQLHTKQATNLEDVYVKTIAEKFSYEKRLIVKELSKHGILSILTPPEKLTINTINKYVELKTRHAL
jgi:uncharacterized protein (DUF58 family)